ncbi:putative two pore calcium channel protein, partial [Trifolium medium]|nr:putative two pore calcium channel protein [Trifolium medium]
MEPLLRGESSGLRNRSRGRVHRTDAITYGSNYEKAAALIDLVR